jgi:hypothetical protein
LFNFNKWILTTILTIRNLKKRTANSRGERWRTVAIARERLFAVRNGSQWFATIRYHSPMINKLKNIT